MRLRWVQTKPPQLGLLAAGIDATVIYDDLGHKSGATTGRYITTSLQIKRAAMHAVWKTADIKPANVKPWEPKAGLLAFLKSRRVATIYVESDDAITLLPTGVDRQLAG